MSLYSLNSLHILSPEYLQELFSKISTKHSCLILFRICWVLWNPHSWNCPRPYLQFFFRDPKSLKISMVRFLLASTAPEPSFPESHHKILSRIWWRISQHSRLNLKSLQKSLSSFSLCDTLSWFSFEASFLHLLVSFLLNLFNSSLLNVSRTCCRLYVCLQNPPFLILCWSCSLSNVAWCLTLEPLQNFFSSVYLRDPLSLFVTL